MVPGQIAQHSGTAFLPETENPWASFSEMTESFGELEKVGVSYLVKINFLENLLMLIKISIYCYIGL